MPPSTVPAMQRLTYEDVEPVMDQVKKVCPHAFLNRHMIQAAMLALATTKPSNPVEFVVSIVNQPSQVKRSR
jgi:hypothetical protein